MNRLNLTTLQLIVTISDCGSLTEAARRSSLTVAAVSKRLLELESQLQVPLFVRRAKGVTPTEAGRAVLAQARQLLYDFDRLQEELSEFRGGGAGTVRLGANAAAMTQFLPEDLAHFMQRHPDVKVDVTELTTDRIVARILDGRLDVGLFADREAPTGIHSVLYRTYRLCAVAPKSSKFGTRKQVLFAEIADQPLIGLEGGSSLLQLLHRRAAGTLSVPVMARSFDVVCRFVQAGIGLGVLPERTAALYARAMDLVVLPLRDEWAHRTILLGTRAPAMLAPLARLLFDDLEQRGSAAKRPVPAKPAGAAKVNRA